MRPQRPPATASAEGRVLFTDILTEVAQNIFIPLTVGGGINTLEDFDRVETQRVDKLLQRMLQCASSQFHLVTISQSPPLLYSDGYLLFPDCNFIGKDILQFSREQTDRLATSLNKRYAASDSFWLAEYTGGRPHLIVYILSESRDNDLNR